MVHPHYAVQWDFAYVLAEPVAAGRWRRTSPTAERCAGLQPAVMPPASPVNACRDFLGQHARRHEGEGRVLTGPVRTPCPRRRAQVEQFFEQRKAMRGAEGSS